MGYFRELFPSHLTRTICSFAAILSLSQNLTSMIDAQSMCFYTRLSIPVWHLGLVPSSYRCCLTGNILQDLGENLNKNLSRILHDFWAFLAWFFQESCMILLRILHDSFKNLAWFIQESCMIHSRILHDSFKNLVWFIQESCMILSSSFKNLTWFF